MSQACLASFRLPPEVLGAEETQSAIMLGGRPPKKLAGKRFLGSFFVRTKNERHLENGHNYLINDGSVGQPRDGDTRACYLEIKGHRAFLHRVTYDYHKTASMIRALGCLPTYCANRLEKGI